VRHHRVVGALLLASTILGPVISVAPAAADSGTRLISSSGTASLASQPDGLEGGVAARELAQTPDDARDGASAADVVLQQSAGVGQSAASTPAAVVTVPDSGASGTTIRSFNGLNLRQQRLANGGNQFTVEPPDQGLCSGNGFVVESVNSVIRIFDPAGNPLTPVVDLNTFYGYPAQFNRTTGAQGPFVTDPSCWFDAETQRFFHIVLTLEVFPDTGDFTGQNHLDLAVSQTSSPLGAWKIYHVDVTDDGTNGTPNHGCPPRGKPVRKGHHEPTHPNACIGDFPHIGADGNGVFVTTNEYCLFCPGIGFHAAQIYGWSKQALAGGAATVAVTQLDTVGAQAGKPGFTLWPATSPTSADFSRRAGGTEFFTSSNAAEEVTGVPDSSGTNASNQIVVWGLSNTSSLNAATPALQLRNTTVLVDRYTVPNPSNQKAGDFPLGQCINNTTAPTPFGPGCWQFIFVKEPNHNEVEGQLDSSDSRVLSTTFARGRLFGTLDTNVSVGGQTRAGVLYYIIKPELDGGALRAELTRQGHLSVPNNNVIYGAVAATHSGKTAIGFTLVGDTHFPTAGYAILGNGDAGVAMNTAAEGVGPQDGFTEYKVFAPDGVHPRPRWGDYGGALALDNNTILLANEFIAQACNLNDYMTNTAASPFGSCNKTRVTLGNWATRITQVNVTTAPAVEGDD
jgi:hypothetical protein